MACENKADKQPIQNQAAFSNFDELRSELNERLPILADDHSWLTSEIMSEVKTHHVSIRDIQDKTLSKSAVSSLPAQLKVDRWMYDVKLELFNKSIADEFLDKLNKGNSDNTFGLLLDPDQFYANDEDDEISLDILKSDNSTETITLKNPDYEIDRQQLLTGLITESIANAQADPRTDYNNKVLSELTYPVFLVTLQAAPQLPPPDEEPPPPPPPTLYPWVEIRYINVLRKHDSGDEEFELLIGGTSPGEAMINPSYPVYGSPYSKIQFNGTNQINPTSSGRTIYMRNVNDESDTFVDPVLIIKLTNPTSSHYASTGWVESDHEDGVLWKSVNATGPFGEAWHQESQYYKWLPTGANGPHTQFYKIYGSTDNNDDLYYGELLGINKESVNFALLSSADFWLPAYYNGLGQLVTDLKVRYGRGYYPYTYQYMNDWY